MNEAREALKFFREVESYTDIEEELQAIYNECTELKWQTTTVDVRRVRRSRNLCKYRRSLLIGCGLVVLQQITGQPSVLYFATDIFKVAGFGGSSEAVPVIIGLAKLVATLVAVVL